MKTILTLLIAIISIKSYSEVLYCVEDQSVGIDVSENNKITKFTTEKYTIEVDYVNKKIYSESLYFPKDMPNTIKCIKNSDSASDRLTCFSAFGTTLILFLNDYSFALSSLPIGKGDDISVSRGKCEKF